MKNPGDKVYQCIRCEIALEAKDITSLGTCSNCDEDGTSYLFYELEVKRIVQGRDIPPETK